MQNLLAGDPIAKQIEDLKLGMLIYEVDRGRDAQFTTVKHACFRGELEDMIAEFQTELLTDRNLA